MSDHPGASDKDDSSDDAAASDPTVPDAMQGELDRILAQMRGQLDLSSHVTKFGEVTRGFQAAAAASAERQREQEAWRERQRSDMDEMFEAQQQARQREIDWQNGLLEQQRLTVAALTEMKDAQNSDRTVNVWVLWIAAASLLATLAGVVIALAK